MLFMSGMVEAGPGTGVFMLQGEETIITFFGSFPVFSADQCITPDWRQRDHYSATRMQAIASLPLPSADRLNRDLH
jgi:hypothetical protein